MIAATPEIQKSIQRCTTGNYFVQLKVYPHLHPHILHMLLVFLVYPHILHIFRASSCFLFLPPISPSSSWLHHCFTIFRPFFRAKHPPNSRLHAAGRDGGHGGNLLVVSPQGVQGLPGLQGAWLGLGRAQRTDFFYDLCVSHRYIYIYIYIYTCMYITSNMHISKNPTDLYSIQYIYICNYMIYIYIYI